MVTRRDSLWKTLDWSTIFIYLILVTIGWFSICGASYDYGNPDFLNFTTRAGKQLVWIICSFALGFVLLMLDDKIYDVFSYLLYASFILLLILTIFVADDIKGSRSWLRLGPVSLQPAEFAKFATALALAKYMNSYSFNIKQSRCFLTLLAIILLPMGLIVMQKETGSALVYLSFFLVLYREGMPGVVLFTGVSMILYFIISIRFGEVMFADLTPSGPYWVLALIQVFMMAMAWIYQKQIKVVRVLLIIGLVGMGISYLIAKFVYPFNMVWTAMATSVVMVGYLLYLFLSGRHRTYGLIAVFALGSMLFLYSSDLAFNSLKDYQQARIKLTLGMIENLSGIGYNVNQSKIAIGSGGFLGKGFLNGTQTKLKYVPEQDTDFIFCTIGEEQGFVGSCTVLLLYLILILRLITLAERQTETFGRVYGYSVVSIFIMHLFINIGMVLGITPVIGIPLPFFSYGGSSLWGFTLLLFIFLRIDAGRNNRL